MKEKLIKIWECKERYIKDAPRHFDRVVFFAQAFGALEMAMAMADDVDTEAELIDLWSDEWQARFEEKVYAEMC